MERYIAVDSGKFATKIAYTLDAGCKTYGKGQFRTKMGIGDMRDDSVESGTYVCEIDGKVMKLGAGALQDADLETSKKSDIHKYSTLLALALVASNNEVDDMHVAIGMPFGEHSVVSKRLEYMDYILPEGEVTIKYKGQKGPVETKTFRIVTRHVYPESEGGLYLDMITNKDGAAIIDIGNLNVNATRFGANFTPDYQSSLTDELGGQVMISNLAAELSAAFTRVDERTVGKVLTMPYEERFLHPTRPNPEIEQKSKEMIDDFLIRHVKNIRRMCDTKHWALDYMPLTFIGGTSTLLRKEIIEVFGNAVIIPEQPNYVNAIGFLRRLLAQEKDIILEL